MSHVKSECPTDSARLHRNTLQQTTTHCNTLQHTATHCNTKWVPNRFSEAPEWKKFPFCCLDTAFLYSVWYERLSAPPLPLPFTFLLSDTAIFWSSMTQKTEFYNPPSPPPTFPYWNAYRYPVHALLFWCQLWRDVERMLSVFFVLCMYIYMCIHRCSDNRYWHRCTKERRGGGLLERKKVRDRKSQKCWKKKVWLKVAFVLEDLVWCFDLQCVDVIRRFLFGWLASVF